MYKLGENTYIPPTPEDYVKLKQTLKLKLTAEMSL